MEIILGIIVFGVFLTFLSFIIACWDEKLEYWTDIFGNSLGKSLYNFNIETNNKFNNFWK